MLSGAGDGEVSGVELVDVVEGEEETDDDGAIGIGSGVVSAVLE